MIPKLAFVEEVDDNNDDTNFELVSYIHIFLTGDNQTQGSVMGHNVGGLPGEQGLLGAELSEK